jgi:hypothetical protein
MGVPVSVQLLLPGTGSITPAGAVTVAVLAKGPAKSGSMNTVRSKLVKPPAASVPVVKSTGVRGPVIAAPFVADTKVPLGNGSLTIAPVIVWPIVGHGDRVSVVRTGELSDSDLWIATGHGPEVISDLEGRRPLVSAAACVVYGHRDRALQLRDGSRDVYREPMLVRNLAELRAAGVEDAANHAAAFLAATGVDRVWLHLDADCLDDELMPAVDWRLDGGLTPSEVVGLAGPLVCSGLIAGMDVTIYNPSLDTADRAAGRVLLEVVDSILS